MRNTMRGFARSIVINGVLPFIIYRFLKYTLDTSELVALVGSGVSPLVDSIFGIIRYKRVDVIAGISLLSIIVGLCMLALGGGPKFYLIRESFFTAAIGLAFLVSMLFPKSLVYYAARQAITGNTPAGIAQFDEKWQHNAEFRTRLRATLRPFGLLWGFGLLFEALVRTYLVSTLSVEHFLVISPFVLYGITFGLFAVQFWLIRQIRRRREARVHMRAQETN